MSNPTQDECVALLKKYARNETAYTKVFNHVMAVKSVAHDLAVKAGVDVDFVDSACMLHDIGRLTEGPTIQHGIRGAKILREEGYPEHAKVCERHMGAGISNEEIEKQSLDLPPGEYEPVTKEEKIITHSDNLIFGSRVGTLAETVQRFRDEISEETAQKVQRLADEVESFLN